MHHLTGRKTQSGEDDGQPGDDDYAAADAEQTRKKAGHRAGQKVSQNGVKGDHGAFV